MQLDKWQKEVLETKGNICLRAGRQVGKSTIISIKAGKYALENKNKTIMVISKTERQAELLFAKILFFIHNNSPKSIKTGKDRPTKHKIKLKNGSIIYCLPTGDTGFGIMGYTINLLIADEAAWIPEEVWNSVIPALAITRGNIWVLSTPYLKEGYFYNCFKDSSFTAFHTTSEDCPRRDDEFLKHKRETLTRSQYSQMYLGEFVDEFKRFFNQELINRCLVLECDNSMEKNVKIANFKPFIKCFMEPADKNFLKNFSPNSKYYLGCDVGRIEDPFTFEIMQKTGTLNNFKLKHIFHKSVLDTPIPENAREIIRLNKQFNFKKEYIDSGGMGIAVCDILREDEENKKKVVEINNASRPYTNDDKTKKILKEDLYNNLKTLMETGKIQLLNDEDVKQSLMSITADFNERGRMIITGQYSHIAEGLIRAAWCAKSKDLNIFIRTF